MIFNKPFLSITVVAVILKALQGLGQVSNGQDKMTKASKIKVAMLL